MNFSLVVAVLATLLLSHVSANFGLRTVMYLTGQHDIIPTGSEALQGVTHMVLAFIRSDVFNTDETPSEFPLFTEIDTVRAKCPAGTKVQVAIGGWGDSGFEQAARDAASRKRWARHVKSMVDELDLDGIDIDWEYPGGNRDDYKQIPNTQREWEIEAFVDLLEELRAALGIDKLLSIAVPAVERDLMAFTADTVPRIAKVVDFINVMTYDMMIRRDTVLRHHSGISGSRQALQQYIDRGAPASKLNLGLGYYVKWFLSEECDHKNLLSCKAAVMEDPDTGADLGRTGAFSWHDPVPEGLETSFARALKEGEYFEDGSYGYWDADEKRWWSFDTPSVIGRKIPELVKGMELGGVFAWGLDEDAPSFAHFEATVKAMEKLSVPVADARDEL